MHRGLLFLASLFFISSVFALPVERMDGLEGVDFRIYSFASSSTADNSCTVARSKASSEAKAKCGQGNVASEYVEWQHFSYGPNGQWVCNLQLAVECLRPPMPPVSGDPFNEASCTGAPITSKNAPSYFVPGTSKAYLGRFNLAKQFRNCNKLTGCGPWINGLDGNRIAARISKSGDPTIYEAADTGTAYLRTEGSNFRLEIDGDVNSRSKTKLYYFSSGINSEVMNNYSMNCNINNVVNCYSTIASSKVSTPVYLAGGSLNERCYRQVFRATQEADYKSDYKEYRMGFLVRY